MTTLQEWLAWALELDAIYQQELGRSCYSDPEAFVNWTWHRANGQTPDWIRDRIRESKEWRERHTEARPPAAHAPAPAGRVIMVTDDRDGDFHSRFYSYWSNAYVDRDGSVVVFAGHADGRPRFFRVDVHGMVHRLGSLAMPFGGTTEGWSWQPDGRISLADDRHLVSVNPFIGEVLVEYELSLQFPDCRLWQSHTSADYTTHCATVEHVVPSGPYPKVGVMAVRHGRETFIPAEGQLDEAQITDEFLVVKTTRQRDGRARLDNLIVNLDTGERWWILDEEGAVGHSDCLGGLLVGEDDVSGWCRLWDLRSRTSRVLFHTWALGHLSFRGGRLLRTDPAGHLALVDTTIAERQQLVAVHGATGEGYDNQVRANLDPTGRVACWMSNAAGRHDVYLLVLP